MGLVRVASSLLWDGPRLLWLCLGSFGLLNARFGFGRVCFKKFSLALGVEIEVDILKAILKISWCPKFVQRPKPEGDHVGLLWFAAGLLSFAFGLLWVGSGLLWPALVWVWFALRFALACFWFALDCFWFALAWVGFALAWVWFALALVGFALGLLWLAVGLLWLGLGLLWRGFGLLWLGRRWLRVCFGSLWL